MHRIMDLVKRNGDAGRVDELEKKLAEAIGELKEKKAELTVLDTKYVGIVESLAREQEARSLDQTRLRNEHREELARVAREHQDDVARRTNGLQNELKAAQGRIRELESEQRSQLQGNTSQIADQSQTLVSQNGNHAVGDDVNAEPGSNTSSSDFVTVRPGRSQTLAPTMTCHKNGGAAAVGGGGGGGGSRKRQSQDHHYHNQNEHGRSSNIRPGKKARGGG